MNRRFELIEPPLWRSPGGASAWFRRPHPIKDATWDESKKTETYKWPGKGKGYVLEILKDAMARGYDAGVSIEPHMARVFHDPQAKASTEGAARKNFVEYGRQLEKIIAELKRITWLSPISPNKRKV